MFIFYLVTIFIGLVIGSFISYLSYRVVLTEVSLFKPSRSFCPKCHHTLHWYDNIPLLGYILQKGHCRHCGNPISKRYPVIELLTVGVTVITAWQLDFSFTTPLMQLIPGLILSWSLLTLAIIDFETMLLPDDITLPILWLGLLLTENPSAAITGAVFGYMILWSIYHLFFITTGKRGLGYGDFKLLAMLGAWMGWQKLIDVLLVSSLVGLVVAGILMLKKQHSYEQPIAFGPWLALAGWLSYIGVVPAGFLIQ